MAKKNKDESNEEFNFNNSEMTSEPVREEPEEPDEEFEPKIKKEENSQIEIAIEEVNLDDEVNFKSFV